MNYVKAACGHNVVAVGAPGSAARTICERSACGECQEHDAHEAADHCLKPMARFGELEAGQLFRFPGSRNVMECVRPGRYRNHNLQGPFSTGSKTAVILEVQPC